MATRNNSTIIGWGDGTSTPSEVVDGGDIDAIVESSAPEDNGDGYSENGDEGDQGQGHGYGHGGDKNYNANKNKNSNENHDENKDGNGAPPSSTGSGERGDALMEEG